VWEGLDVVAWDGQRQERKVFSWLTYYQNIQRQTEKVQKNRAGKNKNVITVKTKRKEILESNYSFLLFSSIIRFVFT